MRMPPDAEVTVEVDAPDPEPAAPDVTIVNADGGGTDGDIVALVAGHGERLAVVETRLDELAGRLVMTEVTAEVAQDTATAAIVEVERVETETEQAVATVAETADAATEEVREEVEDIAPDREHPWFAGRSVFGRQRAER